MKRGKEAQFPPTSPIHVPSAQIHLSNDTLSLYGCHVFISLLSPMNLGRQLQESVAGKRCLRGRESDGSDGRACRSHSIPQSLVNNQQSRRSGDARSPNMNPIMFT